MAIISISTLETFTPDSPDSAKYYFIPPPHPVQVVVMEQVKSEALNEEKGWRCVYLYLARPDWLQYLGQPPLLPRNIGKQNSKILPARVIQLSRISPQVTSKQQATLPGPGVKVNKQTRLRKYVTSSQ